MLAGSNNGTHDPNDARSNRVLYVKVGDGAMMSLPFRYWLRRLCHSKDTTPPKFSDDRMLAAGVFESYRYLVMECTKDEAWRRIQIMRAAVLANLEPDNA